MLIKKPADIPPSEITPESVYLNRRQFVAGLGLASATALLAGCAEADSGNSQPTVDEAIPGRVLSFSAASDTAAGFSTDESITPYRYASSYNNFYEFGTDKSDPKKYAHQMRIDPWTVRVEGEARHTGDFALEDLLKPHALEERIYRLRCVEAWSMVIPWVGIPLRDVIKRLEPGGAARYIAFETLHRPAEMRGQRSRFGTIDWPYVEALRLDEAMHPLTLLAVGMYGKSLPNQNGAPLRLVVPWKYGFKSIKSIVKIRFSETMPPTSWNLSAPHEYGFYSNVNPEVDHPRWSQASERRLPTSLFDANRIPTLPFNGYAEQVASLYSGMNLRTYF